ncbi:MAG: hypothetical protein PVF79_17605 [Desulfobacterales bacterium]|jgi:hypothetical protein
MAEDTDNSSHISENSRTTRTGPGPRQSSQTSNGHSKASEAQMDAWRILLVDLAYLLSSYFVDVQYWEGMKSEKDTFEQLSRTLRKLSQLPENDESILIRFRGFPNGKKQSEKSDYVVLYGNIAVDKDIANAVTYRQGIHMSHLAGRLSRSFEIFSQHGINTLYLNLADLSPLGRERLRVCLHIISHYKQALKTSDPIVFESRGKRVHLPLVYDEQNQADLNLILLAGLNGLTPKASERLVRHVSAWLQQFEQPTSGDQYISVYNAIFRDKILEGKLIKPPIEINNIKWLKVDGGQKVVFDGQDEFSEASFVPQAIRDAFGVLPDPSAKYPDSIDGISLDHIDPKEVGQRLQDAFNLIDKIESRTEGWELLEEVIQSIQGRFELAGDSVFDSMIVEKDDLKIMAQGKEIAIEGLNRNLLDRIEYYKERSVFKKKMRAIAACGIDFDTEDYQDLAERFDMATEDMKEIITRVKGCFDEQGHFLKGTFDQHIREFADYPENIFALFWQYLKEPLERKDRVAFLNSLQLLIAEMNSAKSAVQVLMADLCHDPANVSFSDRNAPMFACILLRRFNKELNLDIEVTPEEVLLVKEGLNAEVVKVVSEIIENHPEVFLEKIQTIQTKINDALKPNATGGEPMPLRYLLSLEREIHILTALVGGETALSVLRNTVKRYGNPYSKIYKYEQSRHYLPAFLQHLKVAIRGLGRIGERIDLAILEDVKIRQKGFLRLGEGLQHENLVVRIMDWIDITRQNILPTEALNLKRFTAERS